MSRKLLKAPNSWPITGQSEEVLFFALQMRECLDVTAWESYRVYSLSTIMRLSEVRKISGQIKSRVVPKKVLEPCLQEIIALVPSDHVASEIIDFDLHDFCKTEFIIDKPIDELISSARLLRTILIKNYQSKCEELILKYCFENPNRIKLRSVTKLYAAFLINEGLSRKYIYDVTCDVFFGDDVQRLKRSKITSYFKRFVIKQSKYRVFVGINKNFAKINQNFIPGKLFADRTAILGIDQNSIPAELGSGQNSSILQLDMYAMDSHSAFLKAHYLLEVSQALLFMYPHSASTKFGKIGYVVKGRSKKGILCPLEHSAIKNSRAIPNRALVQSFERLINLLFSNYGVDDISRRRMIRAATTASLADKSESLENQLVSIWAAFEALLPRLEMEDGTRILRFCDQIVPCTVSNYSKDTLFQLEKSLKDSFGRRYLDFIGNIEIEGSNEKKLLEILIGIDTELKRDLLEIVSESPLAKNRLAYIENILSSNKKYLSFIAGHERRVRWQVHRIYRERNSIVHTGEASPFLRGLVSNSVNYFRKTCENLVTYQEQNSLASIDECITGIRYSYRDRVNRFQSISSREQDSDVVRNDLIRKEMHH